MQVAFSGISAMFCVENCCKVSISTADPSEISSRAWSDMLNRKVLEIAAFRTGGVRNPDTVLMLRAEEIIREEEIFMVDRGCVV